MLQAIKNHNNDNRKYYIFYSFQSTADEMVLIKKYGFGLERDIKGRPLIYPIENYDECKKNAII